MAQVTQATRRDPIRSLANRIILKISGRWLRAYSILTHVGRRSGRQYRNPVSAYPLGDGFVIAILYGAQSQWVRNVMANTSRGSQSRRPACDLPVHQATALIRTVPPDRRGEVIDMADSAVVALAADSLPDMAMSDVLTGTWKAIRRRHPKVPEATVSLAPVRGSACGSVAWDAGMPVILVGGQTISEGPLAILECLLHQAAPVCGKPFIP